MKAVTTNVVGGLGNQLFLLANLIAASRRTAVGSAQQQHYQNSTQHHHVPMFLKREQWSSSVEEPRPTYWSSLLKGLDKVHVLPEEVVGLHKNNSSSYDEEEEIVIPENAKHPAPIDLNNVRGDGGGGGHEHHQFYIDNTNKQAGGNAALTPITDPAQLQGRIGRFVGFFQSNEYFEDHRDEVLRLLFPQELRRAVQHMMNEKVDGFATGSNGGDIFEAEVATSVVGLHVRRGDYLRMTDVFAQNSFDYYKAALQQLYGRSLSRGHHNPTMLIFCEDREYAELMAGCLRTQFPKCVVLVVSKELVAIPTASTTSSVAENNAVKQVVESLPQEVVELLMMTLCDDLVMTNSSFSWWGAYANAKPGARIVAPSKWFVKEPFAQRLYCPNWMIL